MKTEKIIAIITGPSTVGKTTITSSCLKKLKNFKPTVTYTSRQKRENMSEDKIMHNISEEEFRSMIEKDEFIEWAEVYGYLYGTSKKSLLDTLENSNILMNIDVKGIDIIKSKFDNVLTIFILPESIQDIERRLNERDMPEDVKKRRLSEAKEWIENADKYDHQIVNYEGKIDQTIEKVLKILEKYDK